MTSSRRFGSGFRVGVGVELGLGLGLGSGSGSELGEVLQRVCGVLLPVPGRGVGQVEVMVS